jgi:hypothetical protein
MSLKHAKYINILPPVTNIGNMGNPTKVVLDLKNIGSKQKLILTMTEIFTPNV